MDTRTIDHDVLQALINYVDKDHAGWGSTSASEARGMALTMKGDNNLVPVMKYKQWMNDARTNKLAAGMNKALHKLGMLINKAAQKS